MTNDPLELYIARFQMSLTGMTLAIRQDIVDEIRAHVHERMCVSGMPIPEILERLGKELRSPFEKESKISGVIFRTEDAKEGPKAFAEKRPPVWKAR